MSLITESKSETAPTSPVEGATVSTEDQKPQYDPAKIAGEVDQKFANWRSMKRPHEVQWFIQAAMTRGIQDVKWNDANTSLEMGRTPSHKRRPSVNKILPKFRARKSKFLKSRYTPIIVPATSDKEDKLNAVASQKALEYAARKGKLEQVYRQTLNWVLQCGKGFIWLYWDETAEAMMKDPATGQVIKAPLGDVCFDAGSPFEVLVPDLGVEYIGQQHEIMRVRAVPLEELKLRYKQDAMGQPTDDLKGDTNSEDLFQYQKQIATLSAKANVGMLSALADKSDRDLNFVIRKELFSRPCNKYPNGRYVVTAGGRVLKYQEELPYGFGTNKMNPYPVVEFVDIELPGQFWATCIVEQLIGSQKEYNDYRQKMFNHFSKMMHPKIIASVFCKWPLNAWNDEAGEVIRIITPPGVPSPIVWTPPPINGDVWNMLSLLRMEMDEISTIPPATQGDTGKTTSGFQVNLLQEANDSINAPDVRSHEMAYEELYGKTRSMMAQGYDVPRLIAMTGRAHIPDVMEFSQNNIDQNAEIIVFTGTSLANSPAVRTQQVIELWNAGILQTPQNPAEGQRKALSMLDANGIGEFQEEKRRDEEKARLENLQFQKMAQQQQQQQSGMPMQQQSAFVHPPLPFDDHQIHYEQHTDQMKSPEFDIWSPEMQKELFAHTILHVKFINPQEAINLAMELGMPELQAALQPPPVAGQQPQGPPPPGQPQQQQQAPPPAPPPQPPPSTRVH